jgi:hypothetical protein
MTEKEITILIAMAQAQKEADVILFAAAELIGEHEGNELGSSIDWSVPLKVSEMLEPLWAGNLDLIADLIGFPKDGCYDPPYQWSAAELNDDDDDYCCEEDYETFGYSRDFIMYAWESVTDNTETPESFIRELIAEKERLDKSVEEYYKNLELVGE